MDIMNYVAYGLGIALSAIAIWAIKTYLVPWLTVKLGAEKYADLKAKIKDLMAAAEVVYDKIGQGKEKSDWVVEQIGKLGLKVSEDTIRNLISGLMIPLENANVVNRNRDVDIG